MRIVAGVYKNRKLIAPLGLNTRPTKEMVKEAIFSRLFNRVIDATVLDLFAGSGNMAIEAKSRGAKKIYLNDHDIKAIKAIKSNINNLNIDNYELYNLDYRNCLEKVKEIKFNLIFLDPPYDFDDIEYVFDFVYDNEMIDDDAIIVYETTKKSCFMSDKFVMIKRVNYGITSVIYYKRKGNI